MFVNGKNVEAKEIQPGLTRKILAYGDEMMTCEFHFEEGVVLAPHSHFNAQTSYVVSGVLEFDVDGEKVTDVKATVTREQLTDGVLIKRGKKSFNKFVLA